MCKTCTKVCMALLSLFLLVISLAIGVAGLFLLFGHTVIAAQLKEEQKLLDSLTEDTGKLEDVIKEIVLVFQPIAIGLVAVGLAVAIIHLYAMITVCIRKRPPLIIFFILEIVLILLGVAFIAYHFAYPAWLNDYGEANVKPTIKKYKGIKEGDGVSVMWTLLQTQLACCGYEANVDYTEATDWKKTITYDGQSVTLAIPVSCCKVDAEYTVTDKNCFTNPSDANSNWKSGCYKAFESTYKNYMDYFVYAVAGYTFLMIVNLILGGIVFHFADDEDDY